MKHVKTFCLVALAIILHPNSASAQGTWTNYDNPNRYMDVAIQGDYIWSGTPEGLIRINKNDKTYEEFIPTFPNEFNPGSPVSVSSITVAPDGALWCGTPASVSKFDGSEWVSWYQDIVSPGFNINYGSYTIVAATDGTIYIYCDRTRDVREDFAMTVPHYLNKDGAPAAPLTILPFPKFL